MLVWLAGRPAAALDPARSLAQFEHTAWTVKQGAPPDIWALAQSRDGYLWLGTGSGLYRFDGVKFEHFRPDGSGDLPSNNITALLALPNGDLWIGYYAGGVSLLRNGRLTSFTTGVPNGSVAQFAQDQDGTIWVATYHGLGRYAHGAWSRVGPEYGVPDAAAYAITVSPNGVIWVAAGAGPHVRPSKASLLFLTRGSTHFENGGELRETPWAFARSSDGRVWVSDGSGVNALPAEPKPIVGRMQAVRDTRPLLHATRTLFDRDGSLWGVQRGAGVIRTRFSVTESSAQSVDLRNQVEQFSMKDGLTSDIAASVLEDREGDIWVGTNLGLDRFRTANIVAERTIPATAPEGYSLTRGDARSFYVSADRSIYRLEPSGPPKRVLRSDSRIFSLAGSRDGGIWICRDRGLARFHHGRLSEIPLPAASGARSVVRCAEDPEGALWIALGWGGDIFRRDQGQWRRVDVPRDLPARPPEAMVFDSKGDGWLAYIDKVLRLAPGTGKTRLFSVRDGLDIGNIQTIVPAAGGLLIGGDMGLARFDGQRMQSLRIERYPVLERISGIAQTSDGETWLNGVRGVVRLSTQGLNLAFEGRGSLEAEVLDFRDGMPGPAQQDSGPTLFEASDGRLWLLTNHGVAWIDPSHLLRNALPPPVSVTSLTGNGLVRSPADHIEFPSGTSNLQIDFTALSLQIPERVQFRYNLEGVDNGWIDPRDRRQAFYTNLGPGAYRFRVIASNNDGVWNNTGSTIAFNILPTFYQSGWFAILCATALLCILYFAYRLRIEYICNIIREKLAERMRERERIARELHDTLLQSFQGLTLSFRAVAARLPPEHASRQAMDHALLRAEQALVEGRERVQGLRAADTPHDLSELFAEIAEKLNPDPTLKVRVVVEGQPRELHPLVHEEIGRIGEEALFNTLRHAGSGLFEVGVTYGADRLIVRFQDDGKGIDPALVRDGNRAGHFGIRGMRERAHRIRGEFTLSSAAGAGVEIKVVVPAKVAYVGSDEKGFSLIRRLAWGR